MRRVLVLVPPRRHCHPAVRSCQASRRTQSARPRRAPPPPFVHSQHPSPAEGSPIHRAPHDMPPHQGIRVHEERHDPANSGCAEAPSPVRLEEGDQLRPRLRRQGFLDGGRDELFADGPMAQECKSSTGSLRAGAFTPGGGPGSSRSARSRTGPGPSQATLAARDRRQRVSACALPSVATSGAWAAPADRPDEAARRRPPPEIG